MGTIKLRKISFESDKTKTESTVFPLPLPLPVERAILKLGNDVSMARRRRHISQISLAQRIGASISTVRRMEKGDSRIPIHFYVRVMQLFGVLEAFGQVLDTAKDDIGLTLMDSQLPLRIRGKNILKTNPVLDRKR
jgi:transcriptional regulator with XRE-family HTH domain